MIQLVLRVTTITATEGKSCSDDETTMTAPGTDISHAGGTEVAATCTTVPSVRKKGHGILSNPKFASFTDPFNLSIDVTNIEDEDEDEDDSDYEPSFSFEAVLPDDVNQNYEEAAFEEEAFGKDGCDDDADAEEESADDDPCPGIQRLKATDIKGKKSLLTTCCKFIATFRAICICTAKSESL
ncbi:hypothetical protein DPMN_004682 [Dreissena polymorpha]|uniref:Uncharacterized protein n=1 Tax=Dreissena polymorpha TaxID=45954 RepID=A0A9D4MNX7_DREPO|nr:hypothetical protein DPMN_004682 [Dreissena polymorpha]